jgi:thiamine biosynthesis lipoprotein
MRFKFLFISIFIIGLLTGCRTRPDAALQRYEFQQPHMGTMFSITLYAPDEMKAREASDAAFTKVSDLDRTMSDYDPESELMQLCRKPFGQPVRVSAELFDVLQKSQRVADLSGGAFDVTVGPVVRLWRRARRTGEMPDAEMLARARAAVGWKKLKLNARDQTVTLTVTNMQLDLGGVAKGYAADAALAVSKSHGISRALVAASGDIAVGDAPPGQSGWRVSVGALGSDPASKAPVAHTLLLENAAVSTSGDAEQFVVIEGKRYSHIVDPRTGIGLTERLQVTIVSRRATETDAFATAVSVLGAETGLRVVDSQSGLAALLLVKQGDGLKTLTSREWSKVKTLR